MWNGTEAEIERNKETETETEIEIYWLRHGRTQSNEEHRYLGKTDEGLSEDETERLQAKKVPQLWQDIPVFSSPLRRCRQTAELLFHKEPLLIPEWEEMDFGLFEGKNYQDLKDDPYYQRWIDSGGTLPFPQGESREAFIRRSSKGLERMFALMDKGKLSGKDKLMDKAVVVVHGGTIMAVLSTLTGGEYFTFQVPNGGGYRTRIRRKQDTITVLELEQMKEDTL